MKNRKQTLIAATFAIVCAGLLAGCSDKKELKTTQLQRMTFEGHDYIFMKSTEPYKGFGGLTHDPDCGCFSK